MDPLTAALILANTIAELIKLAIESQPIETRADFARLQLEDYKKWREFIDRFKLPKTVSERFAMTIGPPRGRLPFLTPAQRREQGITKAQPKKRR